MASYSDHPGLIISKLNWVKLCERSGYFNCLHKYVKYPDIDVLTFITPHSTLDSPITFTHLAFTIAVMFISNGICDNHYNLSDITPHELVSVSLFLQSDYLMNMILHYLLCPSTAARIMCAVANCYGIQHTYSLRVKNYIDKKIGIPPNVVLDLITGPPHDFYICRHLKQKVRNRNRLNERFWSYHLQPFTVCAICQHGFEDKSPHFVGPMQELQFLPCCFGLVHVLCFSISISKPSRVQMNDFGEIVEFEYLWHCPRCRSNLSSGLLEDLRPGAVTRNTLRYESKISCLAVCPRVRSALDDVD